MSSSVSGQRFRTLFNRVPDGRDVQEARYWLEQIDQYCWKRNLSNVSHDAHMAALGAALWGKELGRRVALLLERDRVKRERKLSCADARRAD